MPTPGYDWWFLRQLRRRDEAAFTQLVRDHQGRIYGFCLRMMGCPEEARDVAQDVFIRVFEALPDFRGDSQVTTWIYRIAANRCRDLLQRRSRRGVHRSFEEDRDGTPTPLGRPDQVSEANQLLKAVNQWLVLLDPEQREILILRDVDGLSYQQIQEVTGLAEGTIKSRLHRGRVQLRRRLAMFNGPVDERPGEALEGALRREKSV